ncbi:MAG TPA: right-handed parallel beta-helix repeat-containing protein [Candidatus Binatia bacterium]|nr:right-handed parallel beta-helix repeat-containing protein [Candidatus Binatia bacterium]
MASCRGLWLLPFGLAFATAGHALEIDPGTDWCRALHQLPPGEELVLRPGEYHGRCSLRRGGTAARPLVIRAQDPASPPRLTYAGRAGNLLDVHASHIRLQDLEFGPTPPDVDAIRIHLADDVRVERCRFTQVGGIAVVANSGSVHGLTVRGNVIRDSGSTAMYFGCHDGSCALDDLLVEDNRIERVDAAEGEVGYGIQVKLNSRAIVRRNTIADTKGPGVMVYGDRDPLRRSLVEGNLVVGSRRSSGIVVGGGPVLVRNNVVLRNAEAGITLQDYGGRGLLRGVAVVHNTVFDNAQAGIATSGTLLDARLVNNAVHARAGTPALPALRPGLSALGNVDCSVSPCFADPVVLDLSPLPVSLLLALGSPAAGDGAPDTDFFGRPRGHPPAVGAIEPGGPRLPLLPGLSGHGGPR